MKRLRGSSSNTVPHHQRDLSQEGSTWVIMSDGSLDTRSLRKEALTMLKSGEAINKTLKWTMRTKMQTSPCRKVYMEVPPALQASQTSQDIRQRTGSPLSTPNLDQATLTHRGISSAQSPSALVEASASIMTLKGNIVPIHYVKDAMVDVIRKEKVVVRSRNTGKINTRNFNPPTFHN